VLTQSPQEYPGVVRAGIPAVPVKVPEQTSDSIVPAVIQVIRKFRKTRELRGQHRLYLYAEMRSCVLLSDRGNVTHGCSPLLLPVLGYFVRRPVHVAAARVVSENP
jgi:hypothetical protein